MDIRCADAATVLRRDLVVGSGERAAGARRFPGDDLRGLSHRPGMLSAEPQALTVLGFLGALGFLGFLTSLLGFLSR
jgi:hypothetical protein